MEEKDYTQAVMKVLGNFIAAQTHPQKQENSCRFHVFTLRILCHVPRLTSDGSLVTVQDERGSSATLARFPTTVEEGRNVSPRGYPATTAFSSLNLGIGSIDCDIAVGGVLHKVKPCSEGTSSHEER